MNITVFIQIVCFILFFKLTYCSFKQHAKPEHLLLQNFIKNPSCLENHRISSLATPTIYYNLQHIYLGGKQPYSTYVMRKRRNPSYEFASPGCKQNSDIQLEPLRSANKCFLADCKVRLQINPCYRCHK